VTVVLTVNTVFAGAVVIADSRLTRYSKEGHPYPYSDVCQKLLLATGWSIVGFAGLLCPARYVMSGIVQRLRSYADTDADRWTRDNSLDWLRDDDHLRAFVAWGLREHGELGGEHLSICLSRPTEVSIVWVDFRPPADIKPEQEFWPGTHVVTIRTPDLAVRRTGIGVDVIGSGAVIAEDYDRDFVMKVMNFGDGDEFKRGRSQALFVADTVRNRIQARQVGTVGGLYQIAHLSRRGVQIVPYFYWADVERGYGTYVAMRIENGYWVQEHRPTGRLVHVLSPFDVSPTDPEAARGLEVMFEPSLFLNRKSPGVLPTPSPWTMAYAMYNPDDFPEPVRRSWGAAPLAPLTWGKAGSAEHPSPATTEGAEAVARDYSTRAP
jgi:hypothetical protein